MGEFGPKLKQLTFVICLGCARCRDPQQKCTACLHWFLHRSRQVARRQSLCIAGKEKEAFQKYSSYEQRSATRANCLLEQPGRRLEIHICTYIHTNCCTDGNSRLVIRWFRRAPPHIAQHKARNQKDLSSSSCNPSRSVISSTF